MGNGEQSYKPTNEDYSKAWDSMSPEQLQASLEREQSKIKEIEKVIGDFYSGELSDIDDKDAEEMSKVSYATEDEELIKKLLKIRGVDLGDVDIEIGHTRKSFPDNLSNDDSGFTYYGANVLLKNNGQVIASYFFENPNSEIHS